MKQKILEKQLEFPFIEEAGREKMKEDKKLIKKAYCMHGAIFTDYAIGTPLMAMAIKYTGRGEVLGFR